ACAAMASFVVENDIVPIQATGVLLQGDDLGPVLRLNWSGARYAPGPRPDLLVLPFRLHDPDGVLGSPGERGVCVALLDTSLPGVSHLETVSCGGAEPPRGSRTSGSARVSSAAFDGSDVQLPVGALLGGREAYDRGLAALLAFQAVAKGIALPALASASISLAAHASSAVLRLQ